MKDYLSDIADGWTWILKEIESQDEEAIINTPRRVNNMLVELLSGYNQDPTEGLKDFDFVTTNDLVIVKDMPFFSLCKHHTLPFFGKAHIGYLPREKVIGLSKIARVVKVFSQRLQLQERLGRQICDTLAESVIKPKGVIVVLEAQHMCMVMRGIKSIGATTITASLSGDFNSNHELKNEFYSLIGRSR